MFILVAIAIFDIALLGAVVFSARRRGSGTPRGTRERDDGLPHAL